MVRSRAPTKTGRQTSARIRRGYCCARDIRLLLTAGRRWRQLRRRDGHRFVEGGEFDEPAVAVAFRDMQLHRVGRLLVDPEIDRVQLVSLERGADERIQLVA